jgi:hypothetical protein
MWITQEPNTLELWKKLHFEEEKTGSIYHVWNIQYLYLLNKYIKCNFRSLRCGTTTRGVVRRQRVVWNYYVKWLCFEGQWSEVSYGEVLGHKRATYIRVTLQWGYLIVLWLFHLVYNLYNGCFNLFRHVWVRVGGGVFVILWVFW